MEAPGNNQVPIQCRAGCGFYGTSATEGMCSKCHKDYVKKRQAPPSGPSGSSFRSEAISSPACIDTASPTVPVILPSIPSSNKEVGGTDVKSETPSAGDLAAAAAGATAATVDKSVIQDGLGASSSNGNPDAVPSADESPDKKKKNRCAICKKKIGLTGFGCRCGGLFCAVHRYSDKHECSYDYRTHGAEEIRKNNPVIKGEKVKQI